MPKLLHSKINQSISSWISNFQAVWTVVVLVFAYIFGQLAGMSPHVFGVLNWAEKFLVGLAIALSALFVVALIALVAGIAFRWWFPSAGEVLPTVEDAPPLDKSDEIQLRLDVEALAKTVRAVIDDYQRMSGLEARLTDKIEILETDTQNGFATANRGFVVLQTQLNSHEILVQKLEMVRVDGAIATRDIEKLREIQKDHHDRALGAFFTIGARERMAILAAEITQDASDLYDRLKAGEVYDQLKWQQWENVHAHWHAKLLEWLETGRWFAQSVKGRTLTVDDAKYGLDWSISDRQFPDAEAVRRFKKFRIIQLQWESVVPDVNTGMEQVAFSGLTELEVRRGQQAG